MEERVLGRTERPVSVIGLGTWQLGADWGEVSETAALDVLGAAVESGVTFFDTADVYGDGRSERLIGRFRAEHPDLPIMVATKMGRRVDQVPENFTLQNFRAWTDRSRRNLGTDQLDLVQLHCPPTAVYSQDQIYDALDTLVADGVIANYGVSVETCDEALTAMSQARHGDGADHPQRFPTQAAGGCAALGDHERCRDHRARAAGQWPAQRGVHHVDHVCRK